jgi:hypothetical protein
MEVWTRHARTRAITRDTVSAANWRYPEAGDRSRDVARVVSDVSVLCPRLVADADNANGLCAASVGESRKTYCPTGGLRSTCSRSERSLRLSGSTMGRGSVTDGGTDEGSTKHRADVMSADGRAGNPPRLVGHEQAVDVDDSVLWSRARSGDSEAFGMLFERHARRRDRVRSPKRALPAQTRDSVLERDPSERARGAAHDWLGRSWSLVHPHGSGGRLPELPRSGPSRLEARLPRRKLRTPHPRQGAIRPH